MPLPTAQTSGSARQSQEALRPIYQMPKNTSVYTRLDASDMFPPSPASNSATHAVALREQCDNLNASRMDSITEEGDVDTSEDNRRRGNNTTSLYSNLTEEECVYDDAQSTFGSPLQFNILPKLDDADDLLQD